MISKLRRNSRVLRIISRLEISNDAPDCGIGFIRIDRTFSARRMTGDHPVMQFHDEPNRVVH